MSYWLDLFTPYTWTRFREHGAVITGFRPRQRRTAFERIKRGDIFICYLVRLSRWCGVLEAASDAYEDDSPVFAEENDPFTVPFRVAPRVMLDFEEAPSQRWAYGKVFPLREDLPPGQLAGRNMPDYAVP